jgi:hypothetical protein
MDMDALMFFKNALVSNQQLAREVQIVRNAFEMSEFWVNQTRSSSNKRSQSEEVPKPIIKKRLNCGASIQGVTIDSKRIEVFAEKYPNCFQILEQKGYMLAATSSESKELLLKRNEKRLDQSCKLEIDVLRACSHISGVLKMMATVDNGIVLEKMKGRASFKDFSSGSILEAKQAFCKNLIQVVQSLNIAKIAHRNISTHTAWVDIHGSVKLTWFQDAEYPATAVSLQKDREDALQLCNLLIPGFALEYDVDVAPALAPALGSALTPAPAPAAAPAVSAPVSDAVVSDRKSPTRKRRHVHHAPASADAPASAPVPVPAPAPASASADGSAPAPGSAHPMPPPSKKNKQPMPEVKNVFQVAFETSRRSAPRPTLATMQLLLSDLKLELKMPKFVCTHHGHADTWGEVTPELVTHMLKKYSLLCTTTMESQGTFIDLGSGHGGLVCMIAALRRFRACFGVEYEPLRASYAHPLAQRFLHNVQHRNLQHSLVQINFGDLLECETTKTFLKTASLIWINNVKFTSINYKILQLLDQYVPIGCVVVTFVSLFSSRGNDSGFVQISDDSLERAGDWTKTAQTVYVIQKKVKMSKSLQ